MYTARIKLPAYLSQADIYNLSEALALDSQSHSAIREDNRDDGSWQVQWLLSHKPDPETLLRNISDVANQIAMEIDPLPDECTIEEVPEDIDWLAQCYQQFPPFSVGPFFIYGSHYDGDVPEGQMGLQIDAARAFGSGEHGTTKGCVQAMLDLKGWGVCPWNILDMGTGSGILALAAWKLWKTPILAVDIDAESVDVALRHQTFNNVPQGSSDVTFAQSDGFQSDIVRQKKPYELIIANILAGPLKTMVDDMYDCVDQNGYIILSGILREQVEEILQAYTRGSFVLKKQYDIGEWSTLILHNAGT